MALDLQPPNLSGLATLAGKSTGLNLTPTGALGLQALQQQQAQEAMLRKNALERMQIQQQGFLGLRGQNIQREAMNQQAVQNQQQGLFQQNELDLRKQQLAQQGALGQDEMLFKRQQLAQQGALGQGALDVDKQKIAFDTMAAQIKQLAEKKKEDLNSMGAFAAQARFALDQVKDPQEAHLLRNDIVDEAVENGFIPKEQAKQLKQLPIHAFKRATEVMMFQTDKAKEYKTMKEAVEGKESKSNHMEFYPDGTLKSLSQDPTKANITDIQKSVLSSDIALEHLKKVQDGYNPAYFTYKGKADLGASKFAEKSKGTPGLETASDYLASAVTGKTKEERDEFVQKRTGYMNSVDQLFNTYKKEITGAAAGEKEMENLRKSFLNGDMSSNEFIGALDQVVEKYKTEANQNRKALNKGIDITEKKTLKYNIETGEFE